VAVLLLIAFIVTPIVEIAVFIGVGGQIGLWSTLAIVIATAFAGTWLLRKQGLATLARAQESLARQEFPIEEVFDGLCLLFAGALLLTPGFVTDSIGLALFVPPVRSLLQRAIRRWLAHSQHAKFFVNGEEIPDEEPPAQDQAGGPTIEGDWKEVRPADKPGPGRPRIGPGRKDR
jgi:UPF0716 protein FxsA